ncbi:hypothetical protein LWI29_031917 [Acer saccharum]|uniref:Uncharacterized protein n=1 Tax=Acer saccharum TaxID=4024 RepID=A0AA39RRZ8_ACESA|nr:hypothetical protein LWI29_031917 [Acer saccharum]
MLSRFVTISRLCTRTITIPAYGNINATIASPARQAFSSVGSDHHGVVAAAAAAAKDSYTKRRKGEMPHIQQAKHGLSSVSKGKQVLGGKWEEVVIRSWTACN